MSIIKTILYNILSAFGQAFGFSLLLAVLFMFFYIQYKQEGVKIVLLKWLHEFKNRMEFRKVFLLAFYIALVLFRTLFNRFAWTNPLQNVIGTFGLYNTNGEFTTEVVENVVMFIPLMFLWMWTIENKKTFLGDVLFSIKNSIKCSLVIEILQLLLRVGQFQISDLVYNTLGGVIGGCCYWILIRIKNNL